MESNTLAALIDKYGLPLEVKKPKWYGDYYFNAESLSNNAVAGSIIRNGSFYESKSFDSGEVMELCREYVLLDDDDDINLATVENPNGLDIDLSHYVQGQTKLFVKKGDVLLEAIFDRFEVKNASYVIYLTAKGAQKAGFYRFPQSPYVFSNKDDAETKINIEKRAYTPDLSMSSSLVAFGRLPKANKPRSSKQEEVLIENQYHQSVDGELKTKLLIQKEDLAYGQKEKAYANENFKDELATAREGGVTLDDCDYISYQLSLEKAERTITKAQDEIYRIGSIRNKPYFARVDFGANSRELHTAYIGDTDIPGYVSDWRSPSIGNTYYHTSLYQNKSDCFLALKRIISIENGKFVGFDDEVNNYFGDEYIRSALNYGNADDILTKLLKESRAEKYTHDIIKTIQDEQYQIITSDFQKNELINGCAGSGKTMIMYHRLSYMAYNYESVVHRKFNFDNVYIISPSVYFDTSNNELIKKLSLENIHQAPMREQMEYLLDKYCISESIIPFYCVDFRPIIEPTISRDYYNNSSYQFFKQKVAEANSKIDIEHYRNWAILNANELLERYGFVKVPQEVAICSSQDVENLWKSKDYYGNDCFINKSTKKLNDKSELYKAGTIIGISFENICDSLKNATNKNGPTYKTRVRRIKENESLLKACLAQKSAKESLIAQRMNDFWKIVDNAIIFKKLLVLICTERLLKSILNPTAKEHTFLLANYVLCNMKKSSDADITLLYSLKLAEENFGSIIPDASIVFIDEFQNYSAMEIQTLKEAYNSTCFNLFGDYDQQIEAKGDDLRSSIATILNPYSYTINVNYRNAKQITEYINKAVHKNMKPIGISGTVQEISFASCEYVCKDRTAIICKDIKLISSMLKNKDLFNQVSVSGDIASDKINILTVQECKGLEFDTVYVFNFDMSENENYVACTRALDNLFVIKDDILKIKNAEEEKKHIAEKKEKQAQTELVSGLNTVQERSDRQGKTEPINPVEKKFLDDELIELERKKAEVADREKQIADELIRLQGYREQIEARESEIKQKENQRNERIYALAKSKMNSKELSQIKEAVILFEIVSDYEDALDLLVECRMLIELAECRMLIEKAKEKEEQQKSLFRRNNLCQYCGGKFKGPFNKQCQNCGRKKDY